MNNNSKVLLGLLVGAAIGGALGILLAPDKGSETRKRIKGGIDDAKKDLGGKYEALKSKSKKQAEETYEDLVSDLASKSEDVISFLETKLAALKKEVAKY